MFGPFQPLHSCSLRRLGWGWWGGGGIGLLSLKSKSLWGLQEGGISSSFSNPSPDPDGPHLPLLPPLLVCSPSHNSFSGFAKDPADQEAVPSISSLTQLQQMSFNLSGPQCPYILARKVRKSAEALV